MSRERQMTTEFSDIFQLTGIVPTGLINRVAQCGGIPESGPGCRSIPRALDKAKMVEKPLASKEQRRSWNLNHKK
jgi:hypothetical protein